MITSVIFDMDGVIIDSEPITSKTYDILLRSMGKTPKLQHHGLIHTPGVRGDDVWKEIMEEYNLEGNIEELRKMRRDTFLQLLEDTVEPMKGVRECIGMLSSHAVKLAIASGSDRNIITHILAKFGLTKFFPVIVSGNDVTKGKPDPECFIKAATQMGVSAKECVVIEDGQPGVIAAKKAGMKVIAVSHQFSKHHDFSQADLVVKSLEEVTMVTLASL